MAFATHHPGPLFEAAFDVETRLAIVAALRRSYDTAVEQHEPRRGSNANTFGHNLYHFAVHELSLLAEQLAPQMRASLTAQSFRLHVGEYELACYRVGSREAEDIAVSFPNPENAAHTMVEPQLWLPHVPEGRSSSIGQARRLVLAHMGNHEDGIRAVYVCVPSRTDGTSITEWAYTECLWTAASGLAPVLAAREERVPDEVIEEPVVRRKVRKKVREDEEG